MKNFEKHEKQWRMVKNGKNSKKKKKKHVTNKKNKKIAKFLFSLERLRDFQGETIPLCYRDPPLKNLLYFILKGTKCYAQPKARLFQSELGGTQS